MYKIYFLRFISGFCRVRICHKALINATLFDDSFFRIKNGNYCIGDGFFCDCGTDGALTNLAQIHIGSQPVIDFFFQFNALSGKYFAFHILPPLVLEKIIAQLLQSINNFQCLGCGSELDYFELAGDVGCGQNFTVDLHSERLVRFYRKARSLDGNGFLFFSKGGWRG